jgi:hypothetical protein
MADTAFVKGTPMKPQVKRPSCSISLPVKQVGLEHASDQKAADLVQQSVIHLVSPASANKDTPFTGLIRRLGSGRIARALLMTPPKPDIDPHLFLLLADQELIEGREEQARYLIEAAYEIFDRKTEAGVYTLHCYD